MKTRYVEFYAKGEKIVGTVYLPDNYTEGTKLPCIIPCSGYTGINAAYPALFARLFTQHGYAALGFDYRGWAPSEGKVGWTTGEDWYFDIYAAYVFAAQQPEIDAANIGLFGWGFSAHVVLKLAADYPEIKAVGCGNGVYNGDRRLRTMLTMDDYNAMREVARQDRIKRTLTGKGTMVNAYTQSSSNCAVAYGEGKFMDISLEAMAAIPVTKVEDDTEVKAEKGKNFTDCGDASAAIAKDYAGKEFPPRHCFETWDAFQRIDSTYDVKKIYPRPIFLVHAVEDPFYPVTEAQYLAKDIGPTCTTCYVTGGHNTWMFDDDPEFIRFGKEIVAFYDKALK